MDYRLERRKAKLKEICGRYVYPWLIEVGKKFKNFGAYPLCLSDYYDDPMDKQVAEVVGLIVPQYNRDKYIMELRETLGTTPWERVCKRDFLDLSLGGNLFSSPGHSQALLFNLLDWIWEVSCKERIPIEYVILGELDIIKQHHKRSITDVLTTKDIEFRMQHLLVKMSLQDGYGTGLWNFVQEQELPCPLDKDLRKVLAVFYPIPKGIKDETIPDILSFMGFEKQVDFLYSAWGYQYLRRHESTATRAFEQKLLKWYKSLYLKFDLFADVPTDCIE